MIRYGLLIAAIAAIVMLGLFIDAQSQSVTIPPQPLKRVAISADGRIEGKTPEIELHTQLAGKINQLLVHEGQIVKKNELLLQLDDAEYQQIVAQANAELDLAKAMHEAKTARLRQAQKSWERIQKLMLADATTEQRVDDQEGLLKTLTAETNAAYASIQAAQAGLDLAKIYLQQMQLHAPQDGQILKIHVENGEMTGPNSPPPIIMADTSQFFVRAFVDELDATVVQLGAKAKITVDGLPGQEFQGTITRISPRMGPKELVSNHATETYDTKTREVWIKPQNGPWIVGLRVNLMIGLK